jgi:predicted RNA-binding Zn-ribbon protein involved in translation (DUF1610 family)
MNTCAICLSPVSEGDAKAGCPDCKAEYHADCWQENGGCALYGCAQAPQVAQRQSIEIPVSYWGQENKPCPACGQQILAAATRCRHCGTTFASARPEDAAAFQQRTALEQRLPKVKRTVLWLFGISAIPCTAPAGAVWGLVWYPTHRDEVKSLPSLYPALCKIGLGLAIGQTIMFVVMGLLYAAFRGA